MLASIDKLLKILTLESQNFKYADKAIIGGLEKFLPTWIHEATIEHVPADLLNQIRPIMTGYSNASFEDRFSKIIQLINYLKTAYPSEPKIIKAESIFLANQPPHIVEEAPSESPKTLVDENNSPAPNIPKKLPGLGLNAPLKTFTGIGPTLSDYYANLGVNTLGDLLYFFPRRYDDYSQLKPINRLQLDDDLTIIATVQSIMVAPQNSKNQTRVEVVVSDGTGFLRIIFFRYGSNVARYMENQYKRGTQLVISGHVEMYLGRLQMKNPECEPLEKIHLSTNGIIPVYPLTAGLTQNNVRKNIHELINFYGNKISDFLPNEIKRTANLIDLSVALHQIHYPSNQGLLTSARERLSFDEIFLMQLGVLQQKQNWQSGKAQNFSLPKEKMAALLSSLPFSLTNAQTKVLSEVSTDLDSGKPMNRLIQGDVGSGKTIIAALAACIVANSDGQSAIMAPTSILAEQHFNTLIKLTTTFPEYATLHPEQIRLLTGDTPQKEREELFKSLEDGTIKLLIGTHALIEMPVKFKNLQFVVIDEQHRFGVAQRAALRTKGDTPHLLVMTATPIPRSLALTLYGDLDLSVMDEMPVGRIPVETHVVHPLERERAFQIISSQIEQGYQAFIIYPLIEKGEDEDAKAAVEEHDYLQREIFPNLRLGLLHGRLKADEKESVMKQFRDKQFDILVSTTVVEVGVDIPNATVMLIEGANRFGLAQLHQLRGRVGRAQVKSYCLLIPDNEDALQNERLEVMTQTNDGFVLAEKDLQQRGPGDFIGSRQSGFAELKMASFTDLKTIEKARALASDLFKKDPDLSQAENAPLHERLGEFWQTTTSDIS
ncbi:MAG: ATP-dependent DNA helicase RecG [Anaerolineaceae bacterium]